MKIQENVPLKSMNSWQVGGNADFLCIVKSSDEIKESVEWAYAKGCVLHILGGGTNVLVSDSGLRGLTLNLSKFAGIEVHASENEILFTCDAGASKAELLKYFLKYKLEAALFLGGIPGTIGGGVVMNAGVGELVTPREFVEIVDWIEVFKIPALKVQRFKRNDLNWNYRHCTGWQEGIITRVGIRVPNKPHEDILDKVRNANRVRSSRQPLDLPSCGSVFRNPPGDKAGRLIEAAGLKGFGIGEAQVSEKHSNFIVNRGGASATDISNVIRHVQKIVFEQFAIELKTEVVWLGDFN